MIFVKTNNVEETVKLGELLGSFAQKGDCICLDGDLGAGKTHLTKGIAIGLGIDEEITSPTFTIVQEYESSLPLFHFDWYRLADEDELYAMGFSDYGRRGGVMVIEWAYNIPSALPKDYLHIRISYGESEDERVLCFEANGKRAQELAKIAAEKIR